jgi:hypothetical protein
VSSTVGEAEPGLALIANNARQDESVTNVSVVPSEYVIRIVAMIPAGDVLSLPARMAKRLLELNWSAAVKTFAVVEESPEPILLPLT